MNYDSKCDPFVSTLLPELLSRRCPQSLPSLVLQPFAGGLFRDAFPDKPL